MHIILGLVVLLSVAAGVIFWLRMISQAAKGAVELSEDVRAAFRRFGFIAKAQTDLLDAVDDPRIAAVGIFIVLARMDGALSREQLAGIRQESAQLFNMRTDEVEDLVVIGKWLAQERRPEEAIRRFTRPLVGKIRSDESRAFMQSAENVSGIEGGMSSQQRDAIDALRREFC